MSEPCAACRAPGYKSWNGDDPKCSFQDGAAFSPDGWNCGTANLIRDVAGDNTDYCNGWRTIWWHEDQYYSAVFIGDIELPSGDASTLWVTWYKHRGRTDAVWLLSEYEPPRLPTEADCLAIYAARKDHLAMIPTPSRPDNGP